MGLAGLCCLHSQVKRMMATLNLISKPDWAVIEVGRVGWTGENSQEDPTPMCSGEAERPFRPASHRG